MAAVTAESLFQQYFWPLYPPDVQADPQGFRDLDVNPADNPTLARPLAAAAELLTANSEALFGSVVTLDPLGVHTLARCLDRATRDRLIAASDPDDPGNPFFNTVVHAAALVGEVAVRTYASRWSLRRPAWESLVQRRTRGAFAPFHWILKGLADDAVDTAPLSYRFRIHVEQASADPDALAVLTPPRSLPTLKAPTYDLLTRYLHQHLPSVRDVGAGFPSPAEFTQRAYASLTVVPLHDGRVLALHGQCGPASEHPGAVEIHWLTAEGCDHTDVLPADPTVPYFARAITRTQLEVTLSWRGRPVTHRLTFQGHG